MSDIISILPYTEQIPLILRSVFENFGYKKYSMSHFEPYDLYLENRNFIKSEGILTFTGANGRLMALRPDVTTSIVKHARADMQADKLYYIENVFRADDQTKEYKEIRQMGLEYIGGDREYAEAEVVFLALQSLDKLGTDYCLNISHMALLEGILEAFCISSAAAEDVKDKIKQKNAHDLAEVLKTQGLKENDISEFLAFASISDDMGKGLSKMEGFVKNKLMQDALNELKNLYNTLLAFMPSLNLRLDTSVINDMDYYNGTVFRGYIKDAPNPVLSGGRYDNMMKRFNKKQDALGFALYLGELDRAFYLRQEYDADIYLYQNGYSPPEVALELMRLAALGFSVYVGADKQPNIKAKHIYEMTENGALEVAYA